MREPGSHLDSIAPADATHLKTARQPSERTSEAKGSSTENVSQQSVSQQNVSRQSVPQVVPALPNGLEAQAPNPAHSALTSPLSSAFIPAALRDRIMAWLRKHVPISRLEHILRVEAMSVALAQQHGIDPKQAALAGLMHDLAKFFKPQRLMQMAQADGLVLDPVEVANPHLLHAAVGAIVARDEFGIQDEAVLDAIRDHTLGCPGMSPLSCVVFLADSLEPGRGDSPTLTTLRHSSQQDLYRAVWQTCDESLRHLIIRAQQIHPRMVLTRNWALALSLKKAPSMHVH